MTDLLPAYHCIANIESSRVADIDRMTKGSRVRRVGRKPVIEKIAIGYRDDVLIGTAGVTGCLHAHLKLRDRHPIKRQRIWSVGLLSNCRAIIAERCADAGT